LLYNMHAHSNLSHDAISPPAVLCEMAIALGLRGLIFSDHCDPHIHTTEELLEAADKNFSVYCELEKKYEGELEIIKSIEVGDAHLFFEATETVAGAKPYDAILGSVHVMKRQDGENIPHTQTDFGAMSEAEIHKYLTEYFDALLFIAQKTTIDILTHLDLPIRYITGKYEIPIDIERYMPRITEILRTIINRNIALEINTSEIGKSLNAPLPSLNIIKLYYDMGGRLFTIGSDSHEVSTLENGLFEARDMLLSLGIEKACYFKNRKPIFYSLSEEI